MLIPVITDTHFDCRNGSLILHEYFEKFYTNIFFPTLEKYNIKHLIHLGDCFDKRKSLNSNQSLFLVKKYFFDPLREREIDCDFIVGNHDSFFVDSLNINYPRLYLNEYKNIHVIDTLQSKIYDGLEILLVPWICKENQDITFQVIEKTKAEICFGHLELQGFKMYLSSNPSNGFDPNIFSKFDIVASGHFHHKSSTNNIMYLGAPYEIIWSDYNDRRGFHILDTETRNFEYIQNPYKLFHKILYDDRKKIEINFENYENTYVKVIIRNKSNPILFDSFIENLEKANPVDYQIVEDHFNINEIKDDEITKGAEDTLTIIRHTIQQLEIDVNKDNLIDMMTNLYYDSQNLE